MLNSFDPFSGMISFDAEICANDPAAYGPGPDMPDEEYMTFKELLTPAIQRRISPLIRISIRDYLKNNGVKACGVTFKPVKTASGPVLDISPVIYIDSLYEAYKTGRIGLNDIASIIASEYFKYLEPPFKNLSDIMDFKLARKRLAFRVVNTALNAEFLNSVPHMDILDLSLVFYYLINDDSGSLSCCTVTDYLINKWNLSPEKLYDSALKNAPRLLPSSLSSLDEAVCRILDPKTADSQTVEQIGSSSVSVSVPSSKPVYNSGHVPDPGSETGQTKKPCGAAAFVLTNTAGVHGSAVIFYKGVPEKCFDLIGESYFILPSSIHELILVRESMVRDPLELAKIVRSVNLSSVSRNEFLSDQVYHYSAAAGCIEYA